MTAASQQRIRDTAAELFSRHGTKRVTVEEICRTAGVSKVTFYKYFRNKKDLIGHIRDEMIRVGFAAYDEIVAEELSFPEKVERMTQWRVAFLAGLPDEFRRELFATQEVAQEVKQRFLGNLAAARAKGEIRSDLSPELIWLAVEKLNELVRDGSWKTACTDYADFQVQMRRLFFYGLLTRSDDESD